jgi:nitrate reductase gamma subunit
VTTFWWVILPYICLTSFVLGHVWRYRYDKFGWTTRSSQLYEKRLLSLASPLFHFGILGVLVGHVIGLLIPESWTSDLGISESAYHAVAATAGAIAGFAAAAGLALLISRRRVTPSVFRVTTRMDKAMYAVLAVVIVLGLFNTVGVGILGVGGQAGYNYRITVSVWFRDVLTFHPSASTMSGVPLSFQLHAVTAFLLFAIWPYTRLVHVLAAPVGYLYRPYIVYRSRDPRQTARAPRRGWERVDQVAGGSG